MPLYIGDWVKEQREIRGISQTDLSNRTGKKVPQSTISMWEKHKITNPRINSLDIIAESLGISLAEIPWDYIYTGSTNDESRGKQMKERFGLYELSSASSLKTFEGKVYELKGYVGVEKITGDVRNITDLYYRTRSVVSNTQILAKRKCQDDELMKVKGIKKTK